MTNKDNKLPTYPVEIIEVEEITINTLPQLRTHITQHQARSRFQQFIDNIALAIVTGSIADETVFQRTTPAVYQAVQRSLARFDELNQLYSTRSTLEGEVNEFLNPEHFTFRKTPNGYTN